MITNTTELRSLKSNLFDSISNSMGIKKRWGLDKFLQPVLWPAVSRFSEIAYNFDKDVLQTNLVEAMRKLLPHFAQDVRVFGKENIPTDGPLLIVSNHPGTFDELVIASNLPRGDLSIVAQNFPFLESLTATKNYLIFTNPNPHKSITTIRSMIRELKNGKSLLIFPSGTIDPDPAFLPGAKESLNNWSSSIELILKKVPETKVMVSIISNILSPNIFHTPLLKLLKSSHRKQSIAEGLQIIYQIFFPHRLDVHPKISFSNPFSMNWNTPNLAQDTVLEKAHQLLSIHLTK